MLHEFHDTLIGGHRGVHRTHLAINYNYYWNNMLQDIKNYVSECKTCQVSKQSTRPPAGLLQPLPIPEQKWEVVGIDFITNLPRTSRDNNTIMVVIDHLSKRTHFIPTVDEITAQGVASLFINNVFKHHGLPKVIISDRDPRFTSEFWKELNSLIGINLHFTSGYHPESNGQTERMNRTLHQYLRAFTNEQQTNWDTLLPFAEFSYNNTTQASTGVTPFLFDYGQEVNSPGNIQRPSMTPAANAYATVVASLTKQAKDKIQRAKTYQAEYANRSRRDESFNVNDSVLVHKSGIPTMYTKKLGPVWYGPFKVIAKYGVAYKLDLQSSRAHPVFHASYLKKYITSSRTQEVQPILSRATMSLRNQNRDVQQPEQTGLNRRGRIHAILQSADISGVRQYLVQWADQPIQDSTWVSAEDIGTISNYEDAILKRGGKVVRDNSVMGGYTVE